MEESYDFVEEKCQAETEHVEAMKIELNEYLASDTLEEEQANVI